MGSGRQFWSWIALDDAIGAVRHALVTDDLEGPVNVVAPNPLTNGDFTAVLAGVLRRPAILPVPRLVARLALGEMAQALLLSSARVEPAALEQSGYAFRHPDLEDALRHLLGAPGPRRPSEK
jgi:NAD dependent epimerase/dehydratase family enzyme